MKNKDNELIFEQYITPRRTNKHQTTTIVETIDAILSLPRVERHGKTLVSEMDIVDVLKKLKTQGLGRVKKGKTMHDPNTGEPRIATADDETADFEQTKKYASEPAVAAGGGDPTLPDFLEPVPDAENEDKLDLQSIEELPKSKDGKIDIVDALQAIIDTMQQNK